MADQYYVYVEGGRAKPTGEVTSQRTAATRPREEYKITRGMDRALQPTTVGIDRLMHGSHLGLLAWSWRISSRRGCHPSLFAFCSISHFPSITLSVPLSLFLSRFLSFWRPISGTSACRDSWSELWTNIPTSLIGRFPPRWRAPRVRRSIPYRVMNGLVTRDNRNLRFVI
jgi:hypothetical protein